MIFINYNQTMFYRIEEGRIQLKLNLPDAKWRDSIFSLADFESATKHNIITPYRLELLDAVGS